MWALALWRPSHSTQPVSGARRRRLLVPLAASVAVAAAAATVVVWGRTGALQRIVRASLVWAATGGSVGLVFGLAGRTLRRIVCATLAVAFSVAAALWAMTGAALTTAQVGEVIVELVGPDAADEPAIRFTVCAAGNCTEPLVTPATGQIAVHARVLDHSGALWVLPGSQRVFALAIDEPTAALALSRNAIGDRIAHLLAQTGSAVIRSVTVDLAFDGGQYVQPGRHRLFMPDSF